MKSFFLPLIAAVLTVSAVAYSVAPVFATLSAALSAVSPAEDSAGRPINQR